MTLPAGMRHAQIAQSVKVVTLDHEVGMRIVATGQVWIDFESNEVRVDGTVVINLIAFPQLNFPASCLAP